MLIEVLWHELGYLSCDQGLFNVTAKGLMSLESARNRESSIGFCAMWFDPNIRYYYDQVVDPTVRSCGYDPLRVDGTEHNGKIDDEIVASIRRSRFMIADFSGHRGGAYYEAGFAHGLGIPVIFTCRDADIQGLHFDIRQFNTITWNDADLPSACQRLKNRILATLGQGPNAP